MLQGGTAPITPQAGGGFGAAPPGFNENESLLAGGQANITPLSGGAMEGGQNGRRTAFAPVAPTPVRFSGTPAKGFIKPIPEAASQSENSNSNNSGSVYSTNDESNEALEAQLRAGLDATGRANPIASAAAPPPNGAQKAVEVDLLKLPKETQDAITEAMQRQFANYLENEGAQDLQSGAKSEEQVGRDAAASSLTVGYHLIQQATKDRITLPKDTSREPPAEDRPAEPDQVFTDVEKEMVSPSQADPLRLEYYKIQAPLQGLQGFTALVSYIAANYQKPTWRNEFIQTLADFEKRRKQTFWTNKTAKNSRAARIPEVKGAQMPTNFDRATYEIVASAGPQSLVVLPPLQGNPELFLSILYTLEKLGFIATVRGASAVRPEVRLRKDIVLVFTPPFFKPAMTYEEGTVADNRRDNIVLFSLFLELEKYEGNQNRVFMMPEHTQSNYVMGRILNEYRADGTKTLANFLDPTYIYYRHKHDNYKGVLVSGSVEGEADIPTSVGDEEPLPPIFRPTNNEQTPRYIVVRTQFETGKQLAMPAKPEGKECDGLLLIKEPLKKLPAEPIYLQETIATDGTGKAEETNIILAFRLKYDTKTPDLALCRSLPSKLVQIPKPPDIFYGTRRATVSNIPTKLLTLTEEDEYLPLADEKPYFRVRVPKPTNSVLEEWYNGIYTDEEANFLNAMGLQPTLVQEAFMDEPTTNWRMEIADFLNSLVVSNCYSDTQLSGLLLAGECQQSRQFLDKIQTFYVKRGITPQSLQSKYKRSMDDEFERYISELQGAASGSQKAFNRGEFTDAELQEITGLEYIKFKRQMNILYVYEHAGNVATNIMVVNSKQKSVAYYRMAATHQEYENDPRIFYNRVDALEEKNPGFSVIY